MLQAIKSHSIERVLLAFDRDAAGERGAEALGARLIAAGIEALAVQFPRGMDANEYALKLKPEHQALGLVLRQARWLGRPATDSATEEETPPSEATSTSPQPTLAEAAPEPEPTPSPLGRWRVMLWQRAELAYAATDGDKRCDGKTGPQCRPQCNATPMHPSRRQDLTPCLRNALIANRCD